MSHPSITEAETRTHQTFTALMWALSHPGKIYSLPASGLAAFGAIADALIDVETSYYSSHSELQNLLVRTGARARSCGEAMYQFYPALRAATVSALAEAPIGTYAFPDESATLILGCTFGAGRALRLSGPGIATTADLWVDGIPDTFWELRAQICRYPLGWDVVLVGYDRLAGLPRTTRIEVV